MWIDEYENQEAIDRMLKTIRDDPELSKIMVCPLHLFVPGSMKTELWTEHFRVD